MSCCGTCGAMEKRSIGAITDNSGVVTTAYLAGGTLAGWWLGGQVAKGMPAKVLGGLVGLLVGRSLLG